MIVSGEWIFFIASEAVFLEMFIIQLGLHLPFTVLTGKAGSMEYLSNRISGFRVDFQGFLRHRLDILEGLPVRTVGQNFLIEISRQGGE